MAATPESATANAADDGEAPPENPTLDLDISGVRILVVDDAPENRLLIRRIIMKYGGEAEQLARAPSHHPQLGAANPPRRKRFGAGSRGGPNYILIVDRRLIVDQ